VGENLRNTTAKETAKMDMKQVLRNLEDDIGNGGVEAQSFAANCYITMAGEDQRALQNDNTDKLASEYIGLCARSGCDGLAHAAGR